MNFAIHFFKNNFRIAGIVFLFMAIPFLNIFCNSSHQTENKALQEYASLSDTIKYVGMDVCKQCHYEHYKTFIETGMGKSFDVASLKKSSAKFDHSTIYDSYSDFHYHSNWQNDSLTFEEFRLNKNDTVYKRFETVSYIIGSGQHTNSHMVNFNGYIYQAPMTYYTQKGQWDLPPGFENGFNSRFTRAIGLECMTCHNSYPDFVKGSENKYASIPNGISCERCHGPGELHVKNIQQGLLVDTSKKIDYSIVNPAKLAIEKQFDVCQRCHIQGNAVLNKGKSFLDFRPGMHLSDVMNVFMPVYEGDENSHIMASHVERLKLSKCYLATTEKIENNPELKNVLRPYKNALTCITCHNPHLSVKVTGIEKFNNACKSCHTSQQKNCSEKPDILAKAENNCVSCHMPKSGAIDIPHVRVTDHYIRKPLKQTEVDKIKKFVTIACINNKNVDDKTRGRAFINYFEKFHLQSFTLDSAKKYFDDSNENEIRENFEELIHIAYLKDDYQLIAHYVEVIYDAMNILNQPSYDNADAYTAYRIGQAFENLGNANNAESFYRKATELAPYSLEFLNKYGSVLTQQNKLSEAKSVFEKIVAENPKYSQGWCNLGFVSLQLDKNIDYSMKCYNKALTLNPDYEQAIINKAGLFMINGEPLNAKKLLQDFLVEHPKSENVKAILQKVIIATRSKT